MITWLLSCDITVTVVTWCVTVGGAPPLRWRSVVGDKNQKCLYLASMFLACKPVRVNWKQLFEPTKSTRANSCQRDQREWKGVVRTALRFFPSTSKDSQLSVHRVLSNSWNISFWDMPNKTVRGLFMQGRRFDPEGIPRRIPNVRNIQHKREPQENFGSRIQLQICWEMRRTQNFLFEFSVTIHASAHQLAIKKKKKRKKRDHRVFTNYHFIAK